MAETLLAILLVTSSAAGSSLVYRWPPDPQASPRLIGPRITGPPQSDSSWPDEFFTSEHRKQISPIDNPITHSASRRSSPSPDDLRADEVSTDRYDDLLGFSSAFLATLLCPQRALCHRKFGLVVDGLAFLGHPVCSEPDGIWRFVSENGRHDTWSKDHEREAELVESTAVVPEAVQTDGNQQPQTPTCEWLQTFHLVLVLDRPDPSSSASGNGTIYSNIIYDQIVFTVTAVLFQEQVISNFVEAECDILNTLRDQCIHNGTSFLEFTTQALEASTLAVTIKTLYEAIKSCSIAYLTINSLPIEVQLPPYLDFLLHPGEEEYQRPSEDDDDYDEEASWGKDMSVGWRLPSLVPWKSLLRLDGPEDANLLADDVSHACFLGQDASPEDQKLAEGLVRFLETANVTLSLADMASVLDWDLELQVYPIVRWLVHHRRAKVVDIVHAGLRTVFCLPPQFDQPLSLLSASFKAAFPSPTIPPLPILLSDISASFSNPHSNTFFAAVVRSKDLIPVYTDVLLWLLKRDMLVTLHLRVRIVVKGDLKARVRARVAREMQEKWKHKLSKDRADDRKRARVREKNEAPTWLSLSPKSARHHARKDVRRMSFQSSERSIMDECVEEQEEDAEGDGDFELEQYEKGDAGLDEEEDEDEIHPATYDDLWDHEPDAWSTIIPDPARATPLQRRWLAAMSEGKDPTIARRFEKINQYFDGKKTDDEILYRAEITRKQLREVLHHYEEFLQTFLHPS